MPAKVPASLISKHAQDIAVWRFKYVRTAPT